MRWVSSLVAILFAAGVAAGTDASHPPVPVQAVCAVCAVQEGSTVLEKVAAHRDHDGRCFYFCHTRCAAAFDADPTRFLPPALPRPAPEVHFLTPGGDAVSLASYRGKVVLVDFWATWCAPCVKALPEIAKLHESLGQRGFVALGVCIDEDGTKRDKFLKKRAFAHPILFDDPAAAGWQAFGVRAIPAAFLLDRDGRIVQQWTGRVDLLAVEHAIGEVLETPSD